MKRTTKVGAATAALALALGAFAVAGPAQAHDVLVSSNPAADSTITQLPDVFSVTMNEDMLNLAGDGSGFTLQITDAAGSFYGDGCLNITGPTLSMGSSLGEAGTYKVVWQIVSGDGHPTDGEFSFTWAGTATSAGSATPPVCGEAAVDPTETATPEATPEPTATPDATFVSIEPISADIGPNPLLIGGAILAVLAATAVVIAVARRKAPGEPDEKH